FSGENQDALQDPRPGRWIFSTLNRQPAAGRPLGSVSTASSQFGYRNDYDLGIYNNTEGGQAFCDPRQWNGAEVQAHVLLAMDCWHFAVDRHLFGRDLSCLL